VYVSSDGKTTLTPYKEDAPTIVVREEKEERGRAPEEVVREREQSAERVREIAVSWRGTGDERMRKRVFFIN
jgi:hypothetical protein